MNSTAPQLNSSLAALRRFAERAPAPLERCELCSAALVPGHQHLIEQASRRLVCTCAPCALLFPDLPERKFRRVPRDVRKLDDFQLTDVQWDNLLVPINMAFFFYSTPAERVVALYPSPAGAMESQLTLEAWSDLREANPRLKLLQPDVEALLVNRLGEMHGYTAPEYYLAPIDRCYELVGLIRAHWRGLSGGTEVWRYIRAYYQGLKEGAPCSS